jgi:hypothetical protein
MPTITNKIKRTLMYRVKWLNGRIVFYDCGKARPQNMTLVKIK